MARLGNTKAGTKVLVYICKVVLQLILKGSYRNETEKRNRNKCRKAGR